MTAPKVAGADEPSVPATEAGRAHLAEVGMPDVRARRLRAILDIERQAAAAEQERCRVYEWLLLEVYEWLLLEVYERDELNERVAARAAIEGKA